MNVLGIGTDIIEIDRIQAAYQRFGKRFLSRIYTDREQYYCFKRGAIRIPELAVRFAAKEAYTKAIGTGLRGIRWRDIEISNDFRGKPEMLIHGHPSNTFVTLSHSRDYATAVVMLCDAKNDFFHQLDQLQLFQRPLPSEVSPLQIH